MKPSHSLYIFKYSKLYIKVIIIYYLNKLKFFKNNSNYHFLFYKRKYKYLILNNKIDVNKVIIIYDN